MPSAYEKRSQARERVVFGSELLAIQVKRYPSLAEVLVGVVRPDGTYSQPAFNLTLFAIDGAIGFSLKARGDDETWFGTPTKSADVLEVIDDAVREWALVAKREKTNPRP
jgi:hypothetical protein